jgi:hypothetical protein
MLMDAIAVCRTVDSTADSGIRTFEPPLLSKRQHYIDSHVFARYLSFFPIRKNFSMSINQLVYVSQATRKMSPADLAAIQDTAKNNNAPLDVTGSLFYNGGWFLQVLEGPVTTLDKLYHKIELDPRHKNSRVLYNEPAKFRTFPRWSMNMINLNDRQADKYDELVEVLEAAQANRRIGSAAPAVALLKMFAS